MTIEEIRKGAQDKWSMGNYAVIVFYLATLFFFCFGCVVGYIFYPIIATVL